MGEAVSKVELDWVGESAECSVSRCAGLRRSTEIVSVRPLSWMVKCLSVREITGNGPS